MELHSGTEPKKKLYQVLYFQVIVAIVAGALVGHLYPAFGASLKPWGDGFIKLIKMVIAPIIFLTVVIGIAGIGDMKKLGRIGLKALLYFEVVSTIALLIGLVVVKVVKPGVGINADPSTLDVKSIAQFTAAGKSQSIAEFILHVIPETVVGAFAQGEILQVLFFAVLFGLALLKLGERATPFLKTLHTISDAMFGVIAIIMRAAPIGAFGAMGFTIGKYGIATLLPLAKVLLCVYITCGVFIIGILGLILRFCGINIFSFLKYIQEEIFIVIGTSSSESALPRMITKLEYLGCAKSVVGLTIPSGYSFNLDGTSIYLTIAALFVAQATNTQLTGAEEFGILAVLMLTSKGAAAVTGGGFITLAATLSSVGHIPVAGITLLLGIDRFMSEVRSVTNLVGNGVATIVVAQWEKQFDAGRAEMVLRGETPSLASPSALADSEIRVRDEALP